MLTVGAWQAAYGQYYTPRSPFGFYLGVLGGLMLLALLSYPLRKHVKGMHRWGALKHWFRVHMFLGLAGPTLILFHSTFQIRSLNAGVALGSMLVVAGSGMIGRFLYTKIHFGLYGRRATLGKLQESLADHAESTQLGFLRSPLVENWVRDFEASAMNPERSIQTRIWHFPFLGIRRKLLEIRAAREFQGIRSADPGSPLSDGTAAANLLLSRYLKNVQRVSEFGTYERLFSLWHVLHIPLIFILAATAVFHVLAQYMY